MDPFLIFYNNGQSLSKLSQRFGREEFALFSRSNEGIDSQKERLSLSLWYCTSDREGVSQDHCDCSKAVHV